MRCVYLILFLFSFSCTVLSQTDTLTSNIDTLKTIIKNADKEEKLILLDSLVRKIENQTESEYDETLFRETIELALDLDSVNIATKHTAFLVHFLTNRLERPQDGVKLFENFIDKNLEVTDRKALVELYFRGANSYSYSEQEQESLEWYEKTKNMALASNDSILYARVMVSNAFAMSELGQFSNSSQEYQKALAISIKQKDTSLILTAKVGLSILYGKNHFHKESLEELDFVLEIARKSKDYPRIIIALTNIGANHYFSGDYEKAIRPLKEEIELSEKHPLSNSSITNGYTILANSYSKLDSLESARQIVAKIKNILNNNPDKSVKLNFLEAKTNLLFAEKNYKMADSLGRILLQLQRSTSNYENILSTLEVLYKANNALGHRDRELDYFKEHAKINDSINSVLKVNAFSYYQTLYETEKRDAQIANQISAIELLAVKNKVQFQWMLLVVITLLSIGIYFYVNNKKNREKVDNEKNKKALAQQKLVAINLENDLLNKEIEYKKKDLINFAIEISQNQQWAKILYEKFEKLKNAENKNKELEIKALGNEIRDKLVVDIESAEFHEKIETLGSSFFSTLNERVPDLSKTELRLITLIRMKVTTKQIATLQNISPASVRTSRYRLRKKLNLSDHEDLDMFITKL